MKILEILTSNVKPIVGKAYKLSDDKRLGDYRNNEVYVETGPRRSGATEQYRVSYGLNMYDVDWIDVWMFNNAKELKEIPDHLIYKK